MNYQNDTPELSIDPLTGTEVIYAPARARRVNAFVSEPLVHPVTEHCPFCVGHEDETPADVYRWPASKSEPWQIRVVGNRYPVVSPIDTSPLPEEASSSFGHHEVLIESPRHDDHWLSLPVDHLAHILHAIAIRIRERAGDPRSQLTHVFKNVGVRAGATLAHPHLQMLTMNYIPQRLILELLDAESMILKMIEQTMQSRNQLVHHGNGFLTLCPPVSRMPYEQWVMPVKHVPYTELNPEGFRFLALQLQDALRRLESLFGMLAHNILWRLPPLYQDHLPWRIEILSRLTSFAGLELSTGLYVNPVRPEQAASQLRG